MFSGNLFGSKKRAGLALTAAVLASQCMVGSLDAATPVPGKVVPTEAQIKVMEQAVAKNPSACEPHFALGKSLCARAAAQPKGGPLQVAGYKRGVNELRQAIRKGKGNATAVAANAYLMSLPKGVIAPRTDMDTPLIAATHGISGLNRGGEASKPKVLEFYAAWCQPCQKLKPLMEKAKTEYGDKVEFVSYNVDDPNTEKLIEDYEVSPIPTLIFLAPDNQVVSYSIGFSGETGISTGLKKILASEPAATPSAALPVPAQAPRL